jgi:hypothetical protein
MPLRQRKLSRGREIGGLLEAVRHEGIHYLPQMLLVRALMVRRVTISSAHITISEYRYAHKPQFRHQNHRPLHAIPALALPFGLCLLPFDLSPLSFFIPPPSSLVPLFYRPPDAASGSPGALGELLGPLLAQLLGPLLAQLLDPLLAQLLDPLLAQLLDPLLAQLLDPLLAQLLDQLLDRLSESLSDKTSVQIDDRRNCAA